MNHKIINKIQVSYDIATMEERQEYFRDMESELVLIPFLICFDEIGIQNGFMAKQIDYGEKVLKLQQGLKETLKVIFFDGTFDLYISPASESYHLVTLSQHHGKLIKMQIQEEELVSMLNQLQNLTQVFNDWISAEYFT